MGDWSAGAEVLFHPLKGSPRKGVIAHPSGPVAQERGTVWVMLEGDPFAVPVQKGSLSTCVTRKNQVRSTPKVRKQAEKGQGTRKMTTKTKRRAEVKRLGSEAKGLGIKGWREMGLAELREAVADAKADARPRTKAAKGSGAKSSAKAKPAASKAKPKASKSAPAVTVEGENPFRKGSDLHVIAPLLLKGGKRESLAKQLSRKVKLHPYSAKKESEVDLTDYDKRLLLAAGTLRRKFGYTEVREGRGLAGSIQVFPPGVSPNGSAKSKSKAKSKR